jgi:hypothetical protein
MACSRSQSSGHAGLDELLGGGWPAGVLTEVAGRGRTSLALRAVRCAQAAGQPVAWVDGGGSFCASTAGVDLEALTFVRPGVAGRRAEKRPPRNQVLFAADILLRSRAFALVVLDMPQRGGSGGGVVAGTWFRLARLARLADTRLMLLHDRGRCLAGSAASLALHVQLVPTPCPPWADAPRPALAVRVLRHRGRPASQQQGVVLDGRAADPCLPV